MASNEESMDPGAADIEGLGRDIQHTEVYFYAYGRLLTLTWVTRLQRAFTTLTDLFGCVGISTNVANTVSMACQPCRALGGGGTLSSPSGSASRSTSPITKCNWWQGPWTPIGMPSTGWPG